MSWHKSATATTDSRLKITSRLATLSAVAYDLPKLFDIVDFLV